jgi:hypothetical protein
VKTHVKKKLYKKFCRDQVMKGLINQANGLWANAQSTKMMDQHMLAGYRAGSKR